MAVFWVILIPVAIFISGIIYFRKLSKYKEELLLEEKEEEVEDYLFDVPNLYEFKTNSKLDYSQLIYVASEEDSFLTSYLEKLTEGQWSKELAFGFNIVYLPNLAKQLSSKEIIEYYAPYLGEEDLRKIEIGNDFLLRYLIHPSDKKKIKHGLMRLYDFQRRTDESSIINKYYPLSADSPLSIEKQIQDVGEQIAEELFEMRKRYRKAYENGSCFGYDFPLEEKRKKEFDADEHFNYDGSHGDIRDLIEEVREKIERLRQYGISAKILDELLHPEEKMSKLIITKDYRLLLPDYNDMEIKMEPLVKAVYLLFMKHPKGIMFKCLPDYRKELTEIYVKLKPYGLSDRVVQSIEDVTNPLLNSINEKCARIRGAFVGQFDNHIAKHYYIDGKRGEAKSISLSRDLVVWE